jgi:hypothetical protein
MTQYDPDHLYDDDDERGISIKPLLQALWRERFRMALAFGALALISAAGLLIQYAAAPKERIATVGFRLTFEGAERGEFPNGTPFSTGEIVSTPVLAEVYRANQLDRYLSPQDFKESLYVLQSNRELEILAYEYHAKLADTRLSAVDRGRLEEEFRRRQDGLRSAEYSLHMRREERTARIPDALMGKVLVDTLSTWAEHVATRKGAVRYNIQVLTKNILSEDAIAKEDYPIAVDLLRSQTERVLRSISEIADLPGAGAVRIGDEQVSLAEVRARLEGLLQFDLERLFATIRAGGLSRNPEAIEHYFAGRLFHVELDREESKQRLAALQDALRSYLHRGGMAGPASEGVTGLARTPVTPQLGESFIDRLLELSSESTDIEYRQMLTDRIIREGVFLADLNKQAHYYQSMRRSFSTARGGVNSAQEAEVRSRAERAHREIAHALEQVSALYDRIAEQNLNPTGILYTHTSPFVVRLVPSLSLRSTLMYFVGIMAAAAVAIPLIVLLLTYSRAARSSRPAAQAPNDSEKPKEQIAGV